MKHCLIAISIIAKLLGLSGCDLDQALRSYLPARDFAPKESYTNNSSTLPSSKDGFSVGDVVDALNKNLAGSFDPIPYHAKNFTYMNCATCSLIEWDGIVTEIRTKVNLQDLSYYMPNKSYEELEAHAGVIVTKPLHLTAFPEENLVYIYSTLLNEITNEGGGMEMAQCQIGDWYCQLQISSYEYQFIAIKN